MIIIKDNAKKRRLFTTIFQIIKTCSSVVHIHLTQDAFSIQGMDHSHVCLFDIQFKMQWFDKYEVIDMLINIDTIILSNILSFGVDTAEIRIEPSEDTIQIDFIHSKYSKFFNIPLIDVDYSWMSIPTCEYDTEFLIPAKIIHEVCSQLITFGDILTICCTEENITLHTKDISKGEMKVVISIDDLIDYSIVEGEKIEVQYSLQYIQKFCLNTNICDNIHFSISKDAPLKISYLSHEDCIIQFFIAPKIED